MEYTKDYTIYTPQLKSGEKKRVRINESLGNFTYDFNPAVLSKLGLNAVSFCFFILWKKRLQGDLNRNNIWFKKELSIAGDGLINLFDKDCFDRKFFDNEPPAVMVSKQRFFSHYDLGCSYLVVRDLKGNFDLKGDQQVAISVTYDEAEKQLIKKPITLAELQGILVKNSNGKMGINKNLTYYETDLEKYLQLNCESTGALFPGDCDMLLYDRDYVCQHIIEFKKTTNKDPRPIEEQSFLNYIKNDRSKYTRLNILRNYFSERESRTISLVTVFYSVKGENKIKLEVINPSLQPEKVALFYTGTDPAENQERLLGNIIELCK